MLDFTSSSSPASADLFSYASWRDALSEPVAVTAPALPDPTDHPHREYSRVGRRFMDHVSFRTIAWRHVSWCVRRDFFTPSHETQLLLRVEDVMGWLYESTGSTAERRAAIDRIMATPADAETQNPELVARSAAEIHSQADAVSVEPIATVEAEASEVVQPQLETKRPNKLAQLRALQRMGNVRVDLCRPTEPTTVKRRAPQAAIGMGAEDKDYTAAAPLVKKSALGLKNTGQRTKRHFDGDAAAQAPTPDRDTEASAISRRWGEKPKPKISLSTGVGAIFSSSIWDIEGFTPDTVLVAAE